MNEQLTDQVLIERVQNGDKQAFNFLVIRYQNKVCNLISRYVNHPGDVPDIAQEAFIKAYHALPTFRGESTFYTWLYRISVNTAKNYLVAQGRRPPSRDVELDDIEHYEMDNALKESANPENLAQTEDLKIVVYNAINSLPEDLKTALTLRELDGLSYEEIAVIMDSPIGTVRSRIFRARDIIDKQIKELQQ